MSNGSVVSYSYNSDGIRTSKTLYSSGGTPVGYSNYTLDGSKIVAENRSGAMIYYTYDDKGAIMGMIYNGQDYIFSKNLQGDVIGIYNSSRQLVAKYEYSAYGRIISITNASGVDVSSNPNHIANINPFRYRGYYYDTETGFYYLQSRYYDPVVGRFLNADAFVSTGQGILGNNMFAYCGNNPVTRNDSDGQFWDLIFDVGSLIVSVVDVCINPSDGWAWAGLAGDAIDLIPFVTGVGESIKGARAANKIVDVVDAVHDAGNIADVAIDGFGNLSRAREYGIQAYNDLRKITRNTGLEAHHIVEKRLVKAMGIEPSTMLSVALTHDEHLIFTKAWRKAFPYKTTDYFSLTKEQIYAAALEIYEGYPELIKAVEATLFP